MSRLSTPAPEDLPEGATEVLEKLRAQLGFVPNMFRTIAANPAVLEAVVNLQSTMSRVLDAKTRHTIALAVSEANGCPYCLAIHTYVSSARGGMSSRDIELARDGRSVDRRRGAAARFAQQVVVGSGRVGDADLAAVRRAGYTDPEVLAIVTVAVQALLTNFLNNVNRTDIDIPAVASPDGPG